MSELKPDLQLEIAHVLFIDVVGYSKLFINEQHEIQERLNQIVRGTKQFCAAEAEGKLTRLPTGDGMALIFFTSPEAPVQCALEIARALRNHPQLKLRMGVHSGPVSGITDVNDRSNVAGAGINIAQRLMDCGDAGHILLSKRIAEDLAHYSHWNSCLHDLGEFEVKHGARISVFNLYTDELGNQATPEKLRQQRDRQSTAAVTATSMAPRQRKIAIAAAGLLMAIILAVAFFISHHSAQRSRTPGGNIATPVTEKRIAVLPFKPLVPENRDQVLEMGMADSLIAKLSNIREMVVRSLNSVRKYDSLEQDPVAAGRELQVNSVLEGNVQKAGDRIRVSARLISVADGSSLWAKTFEENSPMFSPFRMRSHKR
jgi:TolB-like protein/class 3 adenylate cyclase